MKKTTRFIVAGLIMSCMQLCAEKYTVTDYGANGNDSLSDRAALQKVFDKAIGAASVTEIVFPPGIYYLDRALFIVSNTKVKLDPAARIVRQFGAGDKVMLISRHCTSDGKYCDGGPLCKHGGHSQISNVEIDGGLWDAACDGSDYIGVMFLCHGQNITVRNVTFKGAGDHALNLSGSADVLVSNCTFAETVGYDGRDPAYWGEYDIGDTSRYNTVESIHLDITDANGEMGNYPMDSTACENITVENCVFENVFAGVGNHHADVNHLAHSITVRNNRFNKLQSYAAYLYGFRDVVLSGNKIDGCAGLFRSAFSDLVASDNVIVDATEHSFFLDESTDAILSHNAVTNCTEHAIYAVAATLEANWNSICRPGGCGIRANKSKISVSNNSISDSQSYGISVTDCANGSIAGNCVAGAQVSGLALEGGDSTCIGNIVSDSGDCGIRAINGARICIFGCRFDKAGNHALSFSAVQAEVVSNVILSATQHGCVADGSKLTFTGNSISGTGRSGMWLTNCSSARLVENEVIGPNRLGSDSDCRGIYVKAVADLTVEDNRLEFSQPVREGVYVDNASGGSVSRNVLKQPSGFGIRVENCRTAAMGVCSNEVLTAGSHGISLAVSNVHATDNVVSQPGGHGFVVSGGEVVLRGNRISEPGKAGFWVTDASNGRIVDNEVTSPKDRGVYLGADSGFVLSGNVIVDSALEGIYVHKTHDAELLENTVNGARGIGIRIEGVDGASAGNVSVCGNVVSSTAAHDIRVCGFSPNSTVRDNVCTGAGGLTFESSAILTATYNPADARNVRVARESLDVATVSWDAMTGITGYIVECSKTPDFLAPVTIAIADPGASSSVVSGLSSSTDWYVRVRSYHQYYGNRYESLGDAKHTFQHVWDEYVVVFSGGDATSGTMQPMKCKLNKVYSLGPNAFQKSGKKFSGWRCSNGRIYDDGVLIFNLSDKPGAEIQMTAIWSEP